MCGVGIGAAAPEARSKPAQCWHVLVDTAMQSYIHTYVHAYALTTLSGSHGNDSARPPGVSIAVAYDHLA